MRFFLCLLACLPLLANSAVHLYNFKHSSRQGGMYAQYATLTWSTDEGIISPRVDGKFIGLSIKQPDPELLTWDPTVTQNANGNALAVMFTNTSYIAGQENVPDMTFCQPKVAVDVLVPSILRVTFVPPAGENCVIRPGDLMKLDITAWPIVFNPVRGATISLTISVHSATTIVGDATRFNYQDVTTVASSTLVVPETISEGYQVTNDLDFIGGYPSTAVTGVVPNFLKLYFTPGITLQSSYEKPATIVIHANDVVFAANPPKVIFAVGSCTGSYATTQINNNSAAFVRSILVITLGPVESCVLPSSVPVWVIIPQAYLAAPTKTGYLLLNIATNEEPTWQWGRGYYTTGPSSVRALTAVVPTTTVTGVTPGLTVVFTLNKALRVGDKIIIGSYTGVFHAYVKDIPITFSPTCSGVGNTMNAFSELTVVPTAACVASMVAGSTWTMIIPEAGLAPNVAAGALVVFSFYTTQDPASVFLEAYTTTPPECGTGLLAGYVRNPNGVVNWLSSYTVEERAELVEQLALISPRSAGLLVCQNVNPYVYLVKVRFAAQVQTVTSVGAPTVIITNWGLITTIPVYAIVVTYPVNNLVLWNELKLTQNIGSVAFVVRVERMLSSGLVVDVNNPLNFVVLAVKCTIVQVVVQNKNGVAGVPLTGDLGTWGQGPNGNVLVSSTVGTVFVGYCGVVAKPVDGDGSDEALLGLLALIAIPFLCCCCLLALLALYLLRKKKDPCCPCPCPDPCAVPCQVPCVECTYTCAQMVPAPTGICPVQSPIGSALYASPSPYMPYL